MLVGQLLGENLEPPPTVHVRGPRMNQNPPVDHDGWIDGW
jgi:hypothetical protein